MYLGTRILSVAILLSGSCTPDAPENADERDTPRAAVSQLPCVPCGRLDEAVQRHGFCLEGPARLLHATLTMCDDAVHAGMVAESSVRQLIGDEAFRLVRATCDGRVTPTRIFAVKGLWGRGCFRRLSRDSVLRVEAATDLCDFEYSYFDMLLLARSDNRPNQEFYLTTRQLARGSCKPYKPAADEFGLHGWDDVPTRGW